MLKERPKAIFIVAKLSERISKFFEDKEAELIHNLFLKAIRMIKDTTDTTLKQSLFMLIKEAIDRRMKEGDYEGSASLISEFYNFGFKNEFKKILFIASELAEKGDFERALKILNSLFPSEIVNELKTQLHFEWGKKLFSLKNYSSAEVQLREAIKLSKNDETTADAKVLLTEVLERQRKYEQAYRELRDIIARNPVEEIKISRKMAKLLINWGEDIKSEDPDQAIDKLNEAYQISLRVGDSELGNLAFKKAKIILNSKKEVSG